MVRLVKVNFILCILAFLFLSCKTSQVSTTSKEEKFIHNYLVERYNSEFEILSFRKANSPGEKIDSYEAKVRSIDFNRRTFYVTISGNNEYSVNVDDFPKILLEEAFLMNLDLENYKDFPLVFELEAEIVERKYLEGINSIDEATQ